jgi:PKD repeat protein
MPKFVSLLALALCVAACNEKSSNPVLPTSPGGTPAPSDLTVSIATDRGQLEANSTSPATLTVTARRRDGTPPPDATEVVLNTSLGNFGRDAAGAPLQLVSRPLAGGIATAQLYAGKDTGVANVLAQVGTATGRLNLPIVTPSPAPVADFTFDVQGLQVAFTDASTGAPASRRWRFGDAAESSDVNPLHTYASAATYTVSLTVTNAGGESTKTKFVSVTGAPMKVSFDADVRGLTALFTDTSTGSPVAWQWDFGDGGTSTAPNPSHTFPVPGSFAVSLTITNGAGVRASGSRFVTTGNPPTADFAVQTAGLRAVFTDTSAGGPTQWNWTFGDCPACLPDTRQNPDHDYARGGTYTVTLRAANTAGSTAKSSLVTVSAGDPPKAAFTSSIDGLTVHFVDASTGAPSKWTWDFGDGSGSGEQNPTHGYAKAGTYTVTLEASNAAGKSTAANTVKVAGPSTADFVFSASGLDVFFFDRSTGSLTAWAWDFGDGQSSPLQNPEHRYGASGSYSVTLVATNAAGSSRVTKLVAVMAPPVAHFTYSQSGNDVTFVDQSSGAAAWNWNFGDCATQQPSVCTSTAQAPPVHHYASGTYTVTLTVTNISGSSTTQATVVIP